ncbi:tRNA-(ms[2]io[6]A)-hydroxylase [Motiliproteus sediminis]|uniref:tRNA-(ms[2]io[6]A)-hydroxylase n=1 Tax=Motiliproteus sediminis TaxID=1468178 RepID=UPI001AF003A8|nr:tRNA-(ms[2]io[6]A)-hydroxylase [Motiliproteus sediminis]
MDLLDEIRTFLPCPTPAGWINAATDDLATLLIDHAHCEKKAASTAMNLMFRYVDQPDLLNRMSRIAREELIHFEQVLGLMKERGIQYGHLTPSRYALGLRQHVRTHEPARLVDTLIIGAFIEARSCERFAALEPHLEDEALARYYRSLFKAEGRHYRDYLELAEAAAEEPIADRIAFFAAAEAELIQSHDTEFRFHSGVPSGVVAG